ncbi:MAG: hypothetical protein GWN29_00020, partial [Gammaproteobacteria bacterium]|nr:hypothetical protein [Gammaproteobacteria bacterium]
SQLNLFGELYTLANAGGGSVEEKLLTVIQSLCGRTKSDAAFVSLILPGRPEPLVKSAFGIQAAEALKLSQWFCGRGLEPMVRAQV